MGKELSAEERNLAKEMMGRARAAMAEIEDWSQKDLDRLSQAIAWYAGNEKTFTRLAEQGVDESEIGDVPADQRSDSKYIWFCVTFYALRQLGSWKQMRHSDW